MRDIDVRSVLCRQLSEIHDDANTLLISELGLCQGSVRVDVAVVNGSISGFEIKSAKDTLERLPTQCEAYSRALDYVTLVTAENHLDDALRMVPDWWGISVAVEANHSISIEENRTPERNLAVDPMALAQLLWRDEALECLKELRLAAGLTSKPRRTLWAKLAQSVPPTDLGEMVRSRLKARKGWLSAQQRVSGGE
jgi:hypothetical protein